MGSNVRCFRAFCIHFPTRYEIAAASAQSISSVVQAIRSFRSLFAYGIIIVMCLRQFFFSISIGGD